MISYRIIKIQNGLEEILVIAAEKIIKEEVAAYIKIGGL